MVCVLSTKEFDTWEKLLPREHQQRVEKIIQELKQTKDVGKPLGVPFFREKKIDKYRVYFLVYEDIDTVLLVTISDKKAQPETIGQIRADLAYYKEFVKQKLKNLTLPNTSV